ncbi:MAG TPA: type 1 glutamine amidotransferase [Aquifex aeolicus]|uniref:Type 1 glutamine amidotransferase n=1 Tax=Aquifex aeolicus TaxID=63363 RepID=A0A9D0YNJ1_AQUAO|nr:type 1 glutamine amidotransferase [Aquifex aeolicus]HIQ26737.1 type 1 glutamine amidotransferase [Aquifex aeolicus]
MTPKVVIFLEELVEDVEFVYPYLRFKEEGFETFSVAPEMGSYKGKKGCTYVPDKVFKEIKNQTFDCVYIPGGYAPDRLRRYPELLEFVKRHYGERKIVGAVCHGPWVLISAGIVKGKKVTGFFAIKDDLVNAGAIYTGKDVEVDENLITATDPNAMLKQLPLIVEKLKKG